MKKQICMSKQEIADWIDFSYQDLRQHRAYIGGYFFNLNQLNDFLAKKNRIERKINKVVNRISVNNTLKNKPALKDHITSLELNTKKLQKEVDFISIKIKAVNKHNEVIDLPVEYNELCYLCSKLSFLNDEIEHFNKFLNEELKVIDKGDENCFFMFVNDYIEEIKQHLRDEVSEKDYQTVLEKMGNDKNS